jgi:hypothetical protein|tara:strand:- start:74 stop:499 length:426 start_codon:yes stop_codon:yes gene_type:complete
MADYLLVYTTKNKFYQNESDTTDHYEAFLDDKEEAEKRYKEVLKMDNLWSASLCVPIQSDQYETSTDYKNQSNKITIPSETWVELYATLSHYVLQYSSLDPLTETDENGDERYTEEKQDEFCDIASEVEDILSGFFIKETN